MPITVEDRDKIGKELLLLGDTALTVVDCGGNFIEVTGLTANDLLVKTAAGPVNLVEYIDYANGVAERIAEAPIVLGDGSTVTVKEMAEALGDVEFRLSDLEAKYNNE